MDDSSEHVHVVYIIYAAFLMESLQQARGRLWDFDRWTHLEIAGR